MAYFFRSSALQIEYRLLALFGGLAVVLALYAVLGPVQAWASKEPVAAYSFDENEGSTAEDSAHSHDATLHGAIWTKEGKYGSALSFDGEDDYLSVPDSGELDLASGLTLEAWIRPSEASIWSSIIAKEDSSEAMPFGYALYGEGEEETPAFYFAESNSVEAHVDGKSRLRLEDWSHLVVTSDGEESRVYLDGELDETGVATTVKMTNGDLVIGGSEVLGHFSGVIDEVRLYSESLTAREIEEDRDTPIDPAGGSSPITVLAEGDLVEGGSEILVSPDSPITVKATDIGEGFDLVSLLVDGHLEQTIDTDEALEEGAQRWCEGEVCSFSYELTPTLMEGTPGPHTLSVRATNKRGYSATEEYPVAFDANPPELSLSGALAGAHGKALEGETAELSISASDGSDPSDSGVAQIMVLIDGNVVDFEIFNCEAGCPEPATFAYAYKESEWGVEPHEVRVVALDRSGNEAAQLVLVNAEPQALYADCDGPKPELVSAGASVSVEEASEALEAVVPTALEPNTGALNTETEWPINPAIGATTIGSPPVSVFVASDSSQGGYIESDAGGGASIAQAGCLLPAETTSAETKRQKVSGAPTVISANSATETDTAIRATAMGNAVINSFRGSAPETVSWGFALEPQQELIQLESGAVAIVDTIGPDIPPREPPVAPEEPYVPAALNQVDLQQESALYDSALANNEIEGEVLAVIPRPTVIDVEGEAMLTTLIITGEGNQLSAVVPGGTKGLILRTEAAVEPLAMCAATFVDSPSNYFTGCGEGSRSTFWSDEREFILDAVWSPNGDIIYSSFDQKADNNSGPPRIYATDTGGNVEELGGDDLAVAVFPSPSSDGEKIVFEGCATNYEDCGVYMMNSDGSNVHLVFDPSSVSTNGLFPSFSADGERIYFFFAATMKEEREDRQLYSMKTDGSDVRQVTAFALDVFTAFAWGRAMETPNGKYIVFSDQEAVYRLPSNAEEAEKSEATLLASSAERVSVSADSKYVLFDNEEGIWRIGIDGKGLEQLAAMGVHDGGRASQYPTYSPSETQISYIGGDHRIYRMPSGGGSRTLVAPAEDMQTIAQAFGNADPELRSEVEGAEELVEPFFLGATSEEGFEVNHAERVFCEESLETANECRLFYGDRSRALDMRDRILTNRDSVDQSTRGNAFQHGFWTALMVKSSTGVHTVKGHTFRDGLVFALLHEGPPPFSWDAKMDFLNDFTGNRFWVLEGAENVTEKVVCEAFRVKAGGAIFIGSNVSPFKWYNSHAFHYRRLIFRKLRSDYGLGAVVRPNGRTCVATW